MQYKEQIYLWYLADWGKARGCILVELHKEGSEPAAWEAGLFFWKYSTMRKQINKKNLFLHMNQSKKA